MITNLIDIHNGIYDVSCNISADIYDEMLRDQNNDPTYSKYDVIVNDEIPSASSNITSLRTNGQMNKNNAIFFLIGNK